MMQSRVELVQVGIDGLQILVGIGALAEAMGAHLLGGAGSDRRWRRRGLRGSSGRRGCAPLDAASALGAGGLWGADTLLRPGIQHAIDVAHGIASVLGALGGKEDEIHGISAAQPGIQQLAIGIGKGGRRVSDCERAQKEPCEYPEPGTGA